MENFFFLMYIYIEMIYEALYKKNLCNSKKKKETKKNDDRNTK